MPAKAKSTPYLNVLAKPIRIYDRRSGAPLAPGASVDVQVTGVVVGGVSVPAGAVALLGNVAVTQTVGPNGYLTLHNGIAGGSAPTHVVLDAAAFVI